MLQLIRGLRQAQLFQRQRQPSAELVAAPSAHRSVIALFRTNVRNSAIGGTPGGIIAASAAAAANVLAAWNVAG